VRLNSVIITFSGFKSGTCQRYSGRVISCIKASPEKRGLFTLQVCSSHYWYTDYDYATAIPADAGNTLPLA
ncbi:hypothetical protein, partial [Salmonella enterica]|uniref:hypothetical protein n=1 Tax=Salmonella enterica TaxID=28901 RepID=UPI003966A94F